MSLFVHNNRSSSIYSINGSNENALTAALSICLSKSTNFLKAVLKLLDIKGICEQDYELIDVYYQKFGLNSAEGITDIELFMKYKFHVIIEAKIGASFPTLNQCTKYIPRFNSEVPNKNKILALLLDSADTGIIRTYLKEQPALKGYLKPLLWANLYDIAQYLVRSTKSKTEEFLLSELCYFIEEEYYMKSYEEEVWIVPLGTEQLWEGGLSFFDIPIQKKIYFHPKDRTRRRAIYFAPRAYGQVQYVQKILGIEYNKEPKQYIPELSGLSWSGEPHTIFRLGEPVKLPAPIKSGKIWNNVSYSDFDLLVNAESVKHAHELTLKRRSEI